MTDFGPWIALSSLVVSLVVLVFGLIQFRRLARKDYVEELSAELEQVRERAEGCERERRELVTRVQALEAQRVELLLDLRQRDAGGPG
jgi:uncharacterized protein YoxC